MQLYGSHHPCWVQTSQCGCWRVTHTFACTTAPMLCKSSKLTGSSEEPLVCHLGILEGGA